MSPKSKETCQLCEYQAWVLSFYTSHIYKKIRLIFLAWRLLLKAEHFRNLFVSYFWKKVLLDWHEARFLWNITLQNPNELANLVRLQILCFIFIPKIYIQKNMLSLLVWRFFVKIYHFLNVFGCQLSILHWY